MLSPAPGYPRLDIDYGEDFDKVSESMLALLHACRHNSLDAALITSRQEAFDWRSSLRIGMRFAASRTALAGIRLALVADHFNDGAHADVLSVARQVGLECRIFRSNAKALAWLSSGRA